MPRAAPPSTSALPPEGVDGQGTRNALRKKRSGRRRDKFIRARRGDVGEAGAKARQTERMIERLEVIEEPRKEWDLQFTIALAGRSGDIVAVASGAVAERGDFIWAR